MNPNDRSVIQVTTVGHALVHTFELSIPIFVPIWLGYFDTTAAIIGIVVAIGYGLFGVGALPGGVLTDAIGSKQLIASCLLGMGLAFLVLSLAQSIWGVAFALALWGATASVYHPAGLRLISTGVTDRGRGFAYHGMAGNLGIALGPLATAILLLLFEWRVVAMVLTVPALVAGMLTFRSNLDETAAIPADRSHDLEETDRPGVRAIFAQSKVLFASAFALVFVMVMFSGTFYRGVLTFLPEIVGAFPGFEPIEIGIRTLEPANYFYVGILLVGVAGQYVGGRLADRIRTEIGLLVGFSVLAVIAVLFVPAVAWGMGAFLIVGALLGFFLFMVQPLFQVTVAEYSPPEARGLAYGFTYLGIFGVGAGGGAIAGILVTYATAETLFLLLAGIVVVPAGLAVALVSIRSRAG